MNILKNDIIICDDYPFCENKSEHFFILPCSEYEKHINIRNKYVKLCDKHIAYIGSMPSYVLKYKTSKEKFINTLMCEIL